MARSEKDDGILSQVDDLMTALKAFSGTCIVVSNEVGLGIVPDNALARRFRDLAGILNQKIARSADSAYFLAAGIPMKIK
jgi:adenosylcobinamide kinase/adenosylcobinamide-phosphate guanylyltransferase